MCSDGFSGAMWTPSPWMPTWTPWSWMVRNGGPTLVAGGVVAADVTQRNAPISTPQFMFFSRVSRSALTTGTWCAIQRRSLMPNSASHAS